jgi:3D (Asp-Asp-Asp) domain-containing protein
MLIISVLLNLNIIQMPVEEVKEVVIDEVVEQEYYEITARISAYAPFDNKSGICNNGDPMNTATMTLPQRGTLAVDPRRLPYGSRVYIPGYGYGTAEDTGSAMRRYEGIAIDVFVETYKEAMEFGVQYKTIRVYKAGDK